MLLHLGPPGPTFPPDRFPLSVPGGETVWDGPHLQHWHLQWDDSTFLWHHLPVRCQSLCLCLNDCRWPALCGSNVVLNQTVLVYCLNADILGYKYNNCPSLMTHWWPVVQLSYTDSPRQAPYCFSFFSHVWELSLSCLSSKSYFLPSRPSGNLADARLAVL